MSEEILKEVQFLDTPIKARLPSSLEMTQEPTATAPAEIMVFPAGLHKINATKGTEVYSGSVVVDAKTADALNMALKGHTVLASLRPFFDFDHDEKEASAWPTAFFFREGLGVFASVEWSEAGREAVVGKGYRSFSPSFFIDEGNPARVTTAPLCMGGLVNNPAFRRIAPLWAREAEPVQLSPQKVTKEQLHMSTETINQDAVKAASLSAELDLVKAQLANAKKEKAESFVSAAVARGAIKAEDVAIQAAYTSAILADEKAGRIMLDSLPSKAATVEIKAASADGGHISSKPGALESLRAMNKEQDASKRGRIYCDNLRAFVKDPDAHRVMAANSLGTLTSDIITLGALDGLKLSFPVLSAVTTDFSNQNASYLQTIRTRIITAPTVNSYAAGSTGYGVISDMTAADKSVVINAHKYVSLQLNANEAAGSSRNFFGEQQEMTSYALGKDLVDALYALFVIGTYTNATTVATASITRATLPVALASAFNTRGVPQSRRTVLLNTAAFAQMSLDPSIVSLATFQRPDLIEQYALPKLSTFQPIEAVNLPATGNMTGFAFTPDAAIIATRLPSDIVAIAGSAAVGQAQIITNPDTGMSVLKTDYMDNATGTVTTRIAWMYGVAAGNPISGQIVKSA